MRISVIVALAGLTALVGCQTGQQIAETPAATLAAPTKTTSLLESLPSPARSIDVAVYEFPDLTGQAKPNESFAEYSRALRKVAQRY